MRASVLAALLIVAGCLLSCEAYYLQNAVWDAFAVEGNMNPSNPLVVNIRNPTWKQTFSYLGTAYTKQSVFTRIYFAPAEQKVYWGPSFVDNNANTNWVPGMMKLFDGLDFGWTASGYAFYWKIQVERDGFRIHFNDLERTGLVPHYDVGDFYTGQHCCAYPANINLAANSEDYGGAGAGTTIEFDRSWAAYFTKTYPCVHPCNVDSVRSFFCCNPTTDAVSCQPYGKKGLAKLTATEPQDPSCGMSFTSQCVTLGLPSEQGGICTPPTYCTTNWCESAEGGLAGLSGTNCQLVGSVWHHKDCLDTVRRRADTHLREQKKTRLRPRATSRRSDSRSANPQTGLSTTGRRSGTINDRHKARHESFVFNFQYLHPVCWNLEQIMYDNQNTAFFEPLFYWCYSAYWCYADAEPVCGDGKLIPRHVYDARLNACLGVRGTIWTDLQIKEVLLSNFTNSSDWFNISNGTIYSVAAVPPEEITDTGLQFLTRLPLWGSLFSDPDCNQTDGCFYAESLPDYFAYKYKNFEYLRDWVDGVNYNSYLQERRRVYNIPRTQFDFRRYCDYFGNVCDENALCFSRRKWPGYSCRCKDGYDGDGYFCAEANFKLAAEFSIDSKELDINATLRLLSEEFSSRTGRPAEYFDVNPYLDTRAFQTVGPNGEVKIVFVFGFENATDLDGILSSAADILAGDTDVVIANVTGDESNGFNARWAKAGITDGGSYGIKMADSEAETETETQPEPPAKSESGTVVMASEDENGDDAEDGEGGPGKESALLFAGGGVAGVAILVAVGWAVHKGRSEPLEACVVAVHGLPSAAEHHTTVSVASESESGESGGGAGLAPPVKEHKWRQGKATQEDSFTLAQDRSGIWKD